jgi:hypothetical protein
MFGTRQLHAEVGYFDVGSTLQNISTSVASSFSGLVAQDLSLFQRYIYTLYAKGTPSTPQLMLFSASTSASASSNWAAIDSVNCQVTLNSSASVSTKTYAAILEARAEKLFSGSTPIRYIMAVLVTSSTMSSGSSSVIGCVTCQGTLPAYGTASSQETAGFVVAETDYI